ncbi:peptide deformylase [Thalassococcus lentus]|uniref:Peptide deformylase n=1 Tax=Thalassococcus lentus TaxID=1210524 RepID=A0ABT4XT57_9RHOB|nr:peptide deformylase [Thalassococcus lentus]MDA7425126.1 peptide deformylase [Thalassococcus lentus]
MSVLSILRWPDACLSQVCEPVAQASDVADLVEDLFETMYDAPGRGIAAPQVGVMKRVFVMDAGWKTGDRTPRVCINPVIESASETKVPSSEGCLSFPGITVAPQRHERIVLQYTDLDGVRQSAELDGFEAICAQHELDHLDGLMHFDRLDPDARAAHLKEYEALP